MAPRVLPSGTLPCYLAYAQHAVKWLIAKKSIGLMEMSSHKVVWRRRGYSWVKSTDMSGIIRN